MFDDLNALAFASTTGHISATHRLDVIEEKTKLTRPPWGDPRPRFNDDKISESKEVKKWVDNYLGMGEWIMDQSVAVLGASGWFERRR